jgi:hypothetical protein
LKGRFFIANFYGNLLWGSLSLLFPCLSDTKHTKQAKKEAV